MAVAAVLLVGDAWKPDSGAANNLSAQKDFFKGVTGNNPTPRCTRWLFDGGGAKEGIQVSFPVPGSDSGAEYSPDTAPTIEIQWYGLTGGNNIQWTVNVMCSTPGVDTPETNTIDSDNSVQTGTVTVDRLETTTITLNSSDSMAAGDNCVLILTRDSSDGDDTNTGDAVVRDCTFIYTRA